MWQCEKSHLAGTVLITIALDILNALQMHNNNIVSILATGSGKSLTFRMPLLFILDAVQIIIMPLNILERQTVKTLGKVGIQAITITAESAMAENFQLRITSSAEIKVNVMAGNHRWKVLDNCHQHRDYINTQGWL